MAVAPVTRVLLPPDGDQGVELVPVLDSGLNPTVGIEHEDADLCSASRRTLWQRRQYSQNQEYSR